MEHYDFDKIGNELKRIRTEHSYTQEQVAEDLGCTISFVSNIENNRAKLNLRVLTYYSKLFHVSIDSILNAGDKEKDLQNISNTLDTEALNILHRFSTDNQEKIIEILNYTSTLLSEEPGQAE